MPSKKNVQDAHISSQLRTLHGALITIIGVFNRPDRDEAMIQEAGISLDRALFPLLVLVERLGPIAVGELAGRVGRDYSTVSKQVAKLETLGLVDRQAGATDRRVTEASVTPKGKVMTDALDAARERFGRALFADWEQGEMDELVRLLQKFAHDIDALK
ncbi:MarR family winged helix-turn-helix transcriptional regulator [Dyella sp. LX-66]|uniref:MarR family winged helix-turn-helix transcriptional regulator n=1 Tax=unclassified Dyella TaxID=2634549 RepID=UPI001BDFA3A4|nr:MULTISPECIES: MarR family winged helix-turn-helix transcriptional regulator [unclassified Dyella]MBT2117556.1 MarR family winged helix-turn-helix transcriptional regulator [Dyella sp. LX-1]MBT2141440.1 MarR family winged helix-turn-helix transcriptional regulator [Dyella sp. LX-66]